MQRLIESWAAWTLVRIQIVTANLDPEVLQWPGGVFVACLLGLHATFARSATRQLTPPGGAYLAAS